MGEVVLDASRQVQAPAGEARARSVGGVLLLLLVVAGVYGPSLGASPLWDDGLWLGIARDSSWASLVELWIDPSTPDYFPVTASCWWLLGRLFGAQLWVIHVASIALHALSSLLVWRLFRVVEVRGAFLIALLFAVHPLCVESVAWAAEFKNCLSEPLYLASFIWFVRAQEAGRWWPDAFRRWALSTSFFAGALLAKPSGVALPLVGLVFVLWRRGRLESSDLRRVVPMLLISLSVSLVTLRFQVDRAIGADMDFMPSLTERLARTGPAAMWYLWNCLWPFERTPMPAALEATPWLAWSIGSWIMLGVGVLSLARSGRASLRSASFALMAFVLLLAPVLGFLPMAHHRVGWVADRLVYLPLICAMAPIGAFVCRTIQRATGWRRAVLTTAVSLSVLLLAGISFLHVRAWSDAEQLWRLTLERNAGAWLAHSRLAVIELERGSSEEALRHFERAVAIRPELPETHSNLGTALRAMGRPDACVRAYREAVRRAPKSEFHRLNLANALGFFGRSAEAEATLRDFLELRPRNAACWATLGLTLQAQGRTEDARDAFRRALEIDPTLSAARRSLQALGPVAP